jgi:hypothetical protein
MLKNKKNVDFAKKHGMVEKVLSHKYVDKNGSKAITALRPREG